MWAEYKGLSRIQIWRYRKAGRITGLVEVAGSKTPVIDVSKAEIEPPLNHERRTTGHPIGRSKLLRGEPGYKDRYELA